MTSVPPMPTELLPQDQLKWPVVFTGRTLVRYQPCDGRGSASVGGPLQQKFTGRRFGPEPLHRIFTFSVGVLPQPDGHKLQGRMALFYGLRYDGCELRYRVPVLEGVNGQFNMEASRAVEVLDIAPNKSSPDWPYQDYPRLLPYVHLEEASRTPIEPEEFAATFTWQGIEGISSNDLVVIVPAIASLGVSMWGFGGDDAAVQIVYRYSYATHEASVGTQCA